MKITHKEWQEIAETFSKAQPSSQQWFALVDAIITYLIYDRIEATEHEDSTGG